jgi:hypothetical protein
MSRPHDWSYPSCMLNQRDCCQQLSSLTYEQCESAPPMQCCEVKDDSPCLSLSLRNWLGLFDLHLLNLLTDLPPGLILIVWMVDKGWVGGNLVFATLSRVFRISMIIIFPTALYSSGVWARYAWVGIKHTDTLLKPKPQEGSFQTRQFWGMFKHCSGALLYPLQWRLHAFVTGARI